MKIRTFNTEDQTAIRNWLTERDQRLDHPKYALTDKNGKIHFLDLETADSAIRAALAWNSAKMPNRPYTAVQIKEEPINNTKEQS